MEKRLLLQKIQERIEVLASKKKAAVDDFLHMPHPHSPGHIFDEEIEWLRGITTELE